MTLQEQYDAAFALLQAAVEADKAGLSVAIVMERYTVRGAVVRTPGNLLGIADLPALDCH